MADDRYYSNTDEGQRFQPGTTAEAGQVDQKFDEVTAGFQEVAQDTDRSLKLPASDGSQELNAGPLQRRRRVVGFDAEGNLALLQVFSWRGNWAANTEYFINDVVVDPATLNWYIAIARHTSGATFTTTSWSLALDYAAVKALLRQEVGATLAEDLQPLVDSAAASANASAQSRNKAREWAEAEGDVEPGQRSAKYWAGRATEIAAGNLLITSLQPGDLTQPKDYVSVDESGAITVRNVADDINEQLTNGDQSASLSRADYASAVNQQTLDLSAQQVFTFSTDDLIELTIVNPPGAGRAMVIPITIYGNPGVTWPLEWPPSAWEFEEWPMLGSVSSTIVAYWNGVQWSVSVREIT